MKKKTFLIVLASLLMSGWTATVMAEPRGESVSVVNQNSEKEELARLLDNVFRKAYGRIFSGRSYTRNSIRISSYNLNPNDYSVSAEGTHSYTGRIGTAYTSEFKCTVTPLEGNRLRVSIKKASKNPFGRETLFWEGGETTITDD